MKNETIINNLRNYLRLVEETDKATNVTETKRRAVKLKMSDFGDKAIAKLYRSKILDVANAVNAFAAKDSYDKGDEYKAVADALNGVYDFFAVNCGMDAYKQRGAEVRFILDNLARHKFEKAADGAALTLTRTREGRSLDSIRGDVEEILYYRLNGLPLPKYAVSASVTRANAVALAAAEKAAEAEKAEKEKAKRDAAAVKNKAKADAIRAEKVTTAKAKAKAKTAA